jgi:hypothetical protein
LARRGTKHVFVARSVARPSIPAVSPREMGHLSAIDVTTRFVLFFLTRVVLSFTYSHERSCMARLGAGMPSWEKQVAET